MTQPKKFDRRKRITLRTQHTRFGDMLYRMIKRKKWSVTDFAKVLGVTVSYVSGIYAGRTKPPLSNIERWSDILGLRHAEHVAFIWLAQLECATPTMKVAFKRLHSYIYVTRMITI